MTSTENGGTMLIVRPSGTSSFQIRRSDTLLYTELCTAIISKARRLIDTLQFASDRGLTTLAESESIVSDLDTLAKSFGRRRTAIVDTLLPPSEELNRPPVGDEYAS